MFKRCTLNCTCVPLATASPSLFLRHYPRRFSGIRERRPLCVSPAYLLVCCGGTAYNENNVLGELVIPQYRIMYNYIAGGQR